jgi:hypothetical protein
MVRASCSVQVEIHPPKIMSSIGLPGSSLIPLLKEPTNGITMRIDGSNRRAYWGYHPYTARAIDCTRERTAIQVDPTNKRSEQSN